MPPKCRQPPPSTSKYSAKPTRLTTFAGSSTSASAPVNPSYDSNIRSTLVFSDLVAMSAKT